MREFANLKTAILLFQTHVGAVMFITRKSLLASLKLPGDNAGYLHIFGSLHSHIANLDF